MFNEEEGNGSDNSIPPIKQDKHKVTNVDRMRSKEGLHRQMMCCRI